MTLKTLTAKQAQGFQTIRHHGLQHSSNSFRFAYDDDFSRSIEAVEERLSSAHVVGVYQSEDLVGIGGIEQLRGKKLSHKWLLWGMYVLPQFQGKGLGKSIVTSLVDHATLNGAYSVQLTVVADNKSAVSLYTKCGFEKFGEEIASFKRDTDFADELLMWRKTSNRD